MTRKKNFKILFIGIGVLTLVIVITLIYAGFTGQLNITGTAVGRDSAWDIHFENVSTITTTGTAKVLSNHQPVINSNNPTQIQDYEVSLTSPSDSVSFTFDVVNDGNYNAKITSVSVGTPQCTSTDTTSATNMCNNLTYTLKYSSGATINQNSDIVYAKDKVTMKVTLTFNDINDASLLPTAGVSISNLGIQINFEQQGNALVNETTGEVTNYRVYHIGDKIILNNEDYWVITNSGAEQDYVVALKDLPLTVAEVDTYGESYGITAVDHYGYGGIGRGDPETGGISKILNAWVLDKFENSELKEINGYKFRLITILEYQTNLLDFSWRYGNYCYYTSDTSGNNPVVITNNGSISNTYVHCKNNYRDAVRPVINVYKSALETNNNSSQ